MTDVARLVPAACPKVERQPRLCRCQRAPVDQPVFVTSCLWDTTDDFESFRLVQAPRRIAFKHQVEHHRGEPERLCASHRLLQHAAAEALPPSSSGDYVARLRNMPSEGREVRPHKERRDGLPAHRHDEHVTVGEPTSLESRLNGQALQRSGSTVLKYFRVQLEQRRPVASGHRPHHYVIHAMTPALRSCLTEPNAYRLRTGRSGAAPGRSTSTAMTRPRIARDRGLVVHSRGCLLVAQRLTGAVSSRRGTTARPLW